MSGKVKNLNGGPGMTVRAVGAIQVESMIPVRERRRAREKSVAPSEVVPMPHPSSPRVPRITRLMALAIKFQDMIERGQVRDYADIARLGYVTRARVTQVMNLLNLAPDIQEALLQGSMNPDLTEREARGVTRFVFWEQQRKLFFVFRPQAVR